MVGRRDLVLVAAGVGVGVCVSRVCPPVSSVWSWSLVSRLKRLWRWRRRAGSRDDERSPETVAIPAAALERFVAAVLVSCGCRVGDAAVAAEVLLLADVRGIDSHGVARLSAYFAMLREGLLNPRPEVRVVRETASTCTVDGDNGLGLIVGPKAFEIAMAKAEFSGSGWVAVRNTHHYGIAGAYSLMALERDMIGLSMTNSSCVVAPCRSAARMLGTNPLAVGRRRFERRTFLRDLGPSRAHGSKRARARERASS